MKKLTLEEFITKAKKIHNNKYDYSLVEYINSHIKVKIKCNKCENIFLQTPNKHLNKQGCPKCVGKNKNTIEFINQAKKLYDNNYDYSLVEYLDYKTKIKIKCNKHNILFEQIPTCHLYGNGCPKCISENKKIPFRLTIEEFITKAKKIHNNKYDYSEVKYINSHTKVKIKCSKHNILFNSTPNSHLSGIMCPKCGIELKKEKFKKPIEIFLKEAKNVHDDKYDYSLVEYINCKTKIKIKCIIHNHIFEQIPESHLRGSGCPICNNSKGELIIENFIKLNNINYETQKTFDDCKFIKKLKFDFYIQEYNLCIEYDGELHFISNEYFGGDEVLKKQKLRDEIKNIYCMNNNIDLLRIKYTEIKYIEKILLEKFNIDK